ncbi:MAG: hypothetical protein ASARMPRED_004661 [Alectoria sarmentosa]|nr:MAG: hypothetical protein ASARMPRED_004661 [Alectoria sarmentosa]
MIQLMEITGGNLLRFAQLWATILANKSTMSSATRSSPRALSFVTESTDLEHKHAFSMKEELTEDRLPRVSSDSDLQLDAFRSGSHAILDLAAIERETYVLERVVSNSLENESTREGTPTAEDQSETEDSQDEIMRLGRTIEMLFDLLPTIRRIRRTHLLRQESKDYQKTTVTVQQSSSISSAIDKSAATSDSGPTASLELDVHSGTSRNKTVTFDQLLNHSLDLAASLETVLHNDETWAEKNGEKVEAYSGVLRKETDRLREFKKIKEGERDSADMQQIISTIATLGKALNETIKDIAVSEKPKISEKTGSRFHLIDTKSADDRDEKIKALVKKFGVYDAKMREQSALVSA